APQIARSRPIRHVLADEELRDHLIERIVHYAVPRSFERVDEPLRDEAGKVRRWELREKRIAAREARGAGPT
ncbi:MAG: hypothetical protein AAEJ52_10920, partial [Myxococcota bacterium]